MFSTGMAFFCLFVLYVTADLKLYGHIHICAIYTIYSLWIKQEGYKLFSGSYLSQTHKRTYSWEV